MIVGHIGGAGSPYEIKKSLRFRASNSANLNRTFGTPTDPKKWTWSGWVKRGILGGSSTYTLFDSRIDANNASRLYFEGSDTLNFLNVIGGTITTRRTTSAVFRDPSAHLHVVCIYDTANAIAADRCILYLNGVRQSIGTAVDPILDYAAGRLNTASSHSIGRAGTEYLDGYLSEINFIDGQALDPSYFGQVSAETGAWIPKKYTGTYGTNGFYLPFNDGSTLGNLAADRSGNGNNWTASNISLTAGSSYDWMEDTPTNNFATLNPLDKDRNQGTLSDGSLKWTTTYSDNPAPIRGTIGVSSGKFYFEDFVSIEAGIGNSAPLGFTTSTQDLTSYTAFGGGLSSFIGTMWAHSGGAIYKYSGTTSGTIITGSSVTGNVTVSLAVDFDSGKGWIGYGGNYWNASNSLTTFDANSPTFTFTPGGVWFPLFEAVASSDNSNRSGHTVNFGQRPFTYTPPTGFKALCTKNLPTPSILNPKKHFDVVLATGANIKSTVEALYSDQALMVVKDRANANNWQWFNDVIGLSAILQSNTTSAETTYSAPTGSSVGYGWKAGGAPVTNNAGSIQSQVSANPQAGFSIVTYTGTGANATVGHGLGVAPKMVIVKNRSVTTNWGVYHASLGASDTQYMLLNTVGAINQAGALALWNNTAPTSTLLSLGTQQTTNEYTRAHVAYCFAEIPGYSKIGSYTGNGSADGPFVYCGFRPRFVLIKRSDAVASWLVTDSARDTHNMVTRGLYPNLSDGEGLGDDMDFTAGGIKVRDTSTQFNANGGTYIFIAFAEAPFQFANAR